MEDTKTLDEGLATFMDKINAAADIISEKIVDVAPEALEGLITIVWARGVFDISITLLYLLVALVSYKITQHWYKKVREILKEKDTRRHSDERETYIFLLAISIFFCVISSLAFVLHIADFTAWLAVFYPEGALALKALNTAGIEI